MWDKFKSYIILRKSPLHIFGLCGIVGVLVDIDHPIAYVIFGAEKYFNPMYGRFLHIPFAIGSGIMLCRTCSHIRRLCNKKVLKNEA